MQNFAPPFKTLAIKSQKLSDNRDFPITKMCLSSNCRRGTYFFILPNCIDDCHRQKDNHTNNGNWCCPIDQRFLATAHLRTVFPNRNVSRCFTNSTMNSTQPAIRIPITKKFMPANSSIFSGCCNITSKSRLSRFNPL